MEGEKKTRQREKKRKGGKENRSDKEREGQK